MSLESTIAPLNPNEVEFAAIGLYADGEVMGLDAAGRVVAWDAFSATPCLEGQA